MPKILVTGSSGWLGRYLVRLLRDRGFEPFGLDVAPSVWTDVVGSVADQSLIDRLFGENTFAGVLHAGALHKPHIARFPQQTFIDVNVSGTLNLLAAVSARSGIPFVFTSTTSLMISQEIRDERFSEAVWLDEKTGPLDPRNIYGVTKLAAEGLCRQHHLEHGMPVVVLRTARFFPEEDDTITGLTGPNLKANEFLHRRATVEDVARAHLAALEGAKRVGFGLYIVSAPTPFARTDATELKANPHAVIKKYHPDAERLYSKAEWTLPSSISRVYDGSLIERELEFSYNTRFSDVLDSIRQGASPPFVHDTDYVSPISAT